MKSKDAVESQWADLVVQRANPGVQVEPKKGGGEEEVFIVLIEEFSAGRPRNQLTKSPSACRLPLRVQ